MALPPALQGAAAILEGETVLASGGIDRSELPAIPDVKESLQTYKGGQDLYAYCALQVRLSKDRDVIVRAVCSAAASLFTDPKNFTGSAEPSVLLEGYEQIESQAKKGDDIVTTNFLNASSVTAQLWKETAEFDVTELAAYIGVLCLAMCKTPNEGRPMEAFNLKRRPAACRAIIGAPNIFVEGSPWLSYEVLQKVHASFNLYGPVRYHLINNCVSHRTDFRIGEQEIFIEMFLLLTDFGLTSLTIVRDALMRYPWLITKIRGLDKEVAAVNKGFLALRKIDPNLRPFAKAMFANHLVLVPPQDMSNLLGVCRVALSATHPTYKNYRGGTVTPEQERVILEELQIATIEEPRVEPEPESGNA